MIYEKAGTGACGSNLSYWQTFEYMFILAKGKIAVFNPLTIAGSRIVNGGIRNAKEKPSSTEVRTIAIKESRRHNIWRYTVGGANKDDRTIHPAVFPECMVRDHISSWSNEGDTVLDPFMGSGTTAKAAAQLNRRYVGFEISAEYWEIARQRIANHQPQLSLTA
jgi:DNA modification methylase